jgi:2,5-diketo-D-gluconate reductase A
MDGQPTRELSSGARMPVLGLGVWQMAEGPETEQAVEWALEAGYRSIDTAAMYKNERSVGAAVRRSGVPREQIFVTTKLMPARLAPDRALRDSLARLGLDYVDLYLIHWPLPAMYVRQWRAFAELRASGLARDIGVSNFGSTQLDALDRNGLEVPAVNQIKLNPFHYSPELLEDCARRGIVVESYSPLAQGRGLDRPPVAAIAERVGRTPAQVMLRWAVQLGAVVIPKSSRRDRIVSNAQIFDFELDAPALAALSNA